jgi:hypothetical protein
MIVREENDIQSDDGFLNERYHDAFTVDTVISEELVYVCNIFAPK